MNGTLFPTTLMPAMQFLVVLVYGMLLTVGAFHGGIWAGAGIGMALLLALASWRLERRAPHPDRQLFILVLVALSSMAALNLFSDYPKVVWHLWLNLLTIYVPLVLLTSPQIQAYAFNPRYFKLLPCALVVGAVALGGELYSDGVLLKLVKGPQANVADYNRSMGFLVLMAFPVLAGLWNTSRRWLVVPFFLILLWPTGLTDSRTAKLALLLGMGTIIGSSFLPLLTRRVLPFCVALLPAWPFAARWAFHNHFEWVAQLPPSWRARTEIWDYMSYRITEHPLLGWGLGAAHKLDYAQPDGAQYMYTLSAAAHPHNVFTELWVELGITGVALGFAFAFLTLKKIATLDMRVRPFAYGAWVVALCMALVGYDFWSDAIMAAFALTAFAFAGLERNLRSGLFATAIDRRGRAADNPDNAE